VKFVIPTEFNTDIRVGPVSPELSVTWGRADKLASVKVATC